MSEEKKAEFNIHPKAIIGIVTLIAMVVGIASGITWQDAGIFGIGVGASMQLIFS
ncbi:MAG: hypothetical protein OXI77_05225 [Chloroflexota bacterium]|nr:hypothetical protein [Chloroflexota bacterium]MDE2909933.1 hypothetical protein [Chloroflexota bacterium]